MKNTTTIEMLEKELEGFDSRPLDEIIEKDFGIKMVERKKENKPFENKTVWTKERCERVLKAFR